MTSTLIKNYRTEQLKETAAILDKALEAYSRAHIGVKAGSPDLSSGKLTYDKTRLYPENLEELIRVRSEQGYLSENINLDDFSYETETDSDDVMTYKLEVTLPDGSVYLSPGSRR